jgi:hypothetical protein
MDSDNKFSTSVKKVFFKNKKRTTITIIVSVLVVFWIIGTVNNGGFKDYHEKAKYEAPDMCPQASAMAQHIAAKHAINPDEVEFTNDKASKQGQIYTCTGVIISKNDFGVKKRANYNVVLRYRGDCEEDEKNAINASTWEVKSEKVTQ